jgi:hypothetical protein
MADWRKVAMAAFLADGKIDEAEVKILRKELWADGQIDNDEVKFLVDLRNTAQKKARARKQNLKQAFEKFFFKAIESNVLKDGKIDDREATWLRSMLFADGQIDNNEKKFLEIINRKAKSTSTGFRRLYDECMSKAKAKAKARAKARAR